MKTTADYNCSQASLYLAADLGWESFVQFLVVFTAFKPKYNLSYAETRKNEISAGARLAGEQARNEVAESLRIQLVMDNKNCLAVMQRLKRYIADAWTPEFFKAKWGSASGNRYHLSSELNWKETKQMMIGALEFVTNNSMALEANGNMPADTFKTELTDKKDAFELTLSKFVSAEQDAVKKTEEKIIANNKIYSDLISMFLDAQELFALESIKEQFVFDRVLKLINPGSPANLTGKVTYMIDGKPVAGLDAMIEEQDLVVKTGAKGEYDFEGVRSGDVTVKYVLNGEVKDVETFRIPPNTTVRRDVKILNG
ncbi:MAG: hypothetical protein ABI855_04680 [Bacteroidota bacterium]